MVDVWKETRYEWARFFSIWGIERSPLPKTLTNDIHLDREPRSRAEYEDVQ